MSATLFDELPKRPAETRLGIDERFEIFDRANPLVWDWFRKFANELREMGRTRISADSILHRCRWEAISSTRSDDEFKINNDFTSRYARKLIAADGRFSSLFETRCLKAQKKS